MDKEEVLKKTKKAIRALLISAPRGIPKRMLLADYRNVMEKELPFRNLGFQNLDDFIRAVPDVIRVGMGVSGEPTLFPVVTAETSQIARFVATQKKPKLKRSCAPPAIVAPPKARMAPRSYGRHRNRDRTRSGNYSSYGQRPRYFNMQHVQVGAPVTMRITAPVVQPQRPFSVGISPRRGRIGSTPTYNSALQETAPAPPRSYSVEPRSPVGIGAGPMWREEYKAARVLSIVDMRKDTRTWGLKLVNVSGYICTPYRDDKVGSGIKYLLYNGIHPEAVNRSDGRGQLPGVMLFFKSSTWSRHSHPDLFSLASGTKLMVVGKPFTQISKLKGKEDPAILVYYYEKQAGSPVLSHGQSLDGRTQFRPAGSESRFYKPAQTTFSQAGTYRAAQTTSSPTLATNRTAQPTSEASTANKSVKECVLEMLRKYENGIILQRINKTFEKTFGRPPPPDCDLEQIVKSVPGVIVEEEVPGYPLVYLKTPPESAAPALTQTSKYGKAPSPALSTKERTREMSQTSRGSVSRETPRSTMPTSNTGPSEIAHSSSNTGSARTKTPTHGYVSSGMKENIYKLLECYPHGVRLALLGKVYRDQLGKEPPNGLADMAKSLPCVVCKEAVTGHTVIYLERPVATIPSPSPSVSTSEGSACSSRSQTPPGGYVTSTLKVNLYKLLESKSGGVYEKMLHKVYANMYKVEAPKGLVELARNMDFVQLDEEILSHPVLYLKKGHPPPTPELSRTPTPPPISLPDTVELGGEEDVVLDVFVTYISSVTSFYVQRVGEEFSERFHKMLEEMNIYFEKNARRSKRPVEVDQLYGYLWDDGGGDKIWCRAVVRSVHDNKAHVMFPDYGNSDLVQVSTLKELPHIYYSLPFQAVQCCLHGLTDDDDEVNTKFNELAINTSCTVQVINSSGSRVSVELMDSDPAVHDTFNSILLRVLHPISTLEPRLPQPGDPMVPVALADIEADGGIVLQVQGPGYNQLQQLMTTINGTYLEKEAEPGDLVTDVREGLVCCGSYYDKWYRVKITKVLSPTEVTVHYVDYGNENDIAVTELRAPINNELFTLPFQAVKCTLHGLPPAGGRWTNTATNLLWDKEEDLQVSVVKSGSPPDSLPSVILLLCTEGEETNLNQWLADQGDIFFEEASEEEPYPEPQPTTVRDPVSPCPSSISAHSTSELSSALSTESSSEPGEAVSTVCDAVSNLSIQTKHGIIENAGPEVSSFSIESQSVTPVFSPHTPSQGTPSQSPLPTPSQITPPLTPPSTLSPCTSSQSTMAPTTPVGSPSPLLPSYTDVQTAELSLKQLNLVNISWVKSPSNFVVQLSSNVNDLEAMMVSLNQALEGSPALSHSEVQPGRLCCAVSSIDDQWNRVLVMSTIGADSVLVEFVDYGGREEVSLSSLKALPPRFITLPLQGIKCSLYGIRPLGDKWSNESIQFLAEFAEKQYYVYPKLQSGDTCSIVLLRGNNEMNHEMVKMRLAIQQQ